MLPVRTGTLIMLLVALLFGGLAVFIAKVWLSNQQAQAVNQPASPQIVKIDTEKIVVAKSELNFGQPLTPEVLGEVDWPKDALPDGVFTSMDELTKNKDGARVVLRPISPNEPILAWKISGPGGRASLSTLVKEGMRAVTIRVNNTTGVAGFVLPGDRVDVLYTRDKGDGPGIDVLFQNVRVIAINQNADEKNGTPIDSRTATLELTPVDAQKIALAESTGGLVFTLRSAGSLDTAPARRIVQDELVSNGTLATASNEEQSALQQRLADLEAKLKQAQSEKAAPEAPASEDALPSTVQVTIFRGVQGSSYTVPLDATQ